MHFANKVDETTLLGCEFASVCNFATFELLKTAYLLLNDKNLLDFAKVILKYSTRIQKEYLKPVIPCFWKNRIFLWLLNKIKNEVFFLKSKKNHSKTAQKKSKIPIIF